MSPRDPGPTRAAVLAAAAQLLERGGPEAVTLRGVGEAAGVSRSAPYRHFDDKTALLTELATQTLSELADRIRTAAAEIDDPARSLRAGCAAYIAHALEHPQHYQLVFGSEPIGHPTPELERAADAGMDAITEIVERAQGTGWRQGLPTRELATVVWVALHGIAQLDITGHLHEPRTLDGSTRVGELVDLALTALGVDAA
ncbi:TetR/AcrR family transcriptional regulator [Pseudoclavibacter chungangensis]|uniref:TetR/AcrR family transcriptional regulator n=1 Tax=Pseudoclavibacter chungangensis TaxID=587635 RepID=A0A7J5C296_9MICO|nr:TetR/AcrR family transcriptional regulator [Pseudoclavibacter chungangensis]KAB1662593.1 TetR/AcrR family transcriptional regulator [Pseudoclavibacter chungangensis]NYJ68642.1 AcrR family transcriptional regulator [Pseudoclavibacter chungangensis]